VDISEFDVEVDLLSTEVGVSDVYNDCEVEDILSSDVVSGSIDVGASLKVSEQVGAVERSTDVDSDSVIRLGFDVLEKISIEAVSV